MEQLSKVIVYVVEKSSQLLDEQYENKVYTLPKNLDEKVTALHLAKIGVKLETLRTDQAEYIGVTVEDPFKPERYRY